MTRLLTAAQMRAIEQAAIASGRVTGLELMERAGRGVVEAILEEWPHFATAPHHALVLCGPGNNGGDGFVVARLLKERGWDVVVYLYGSIEKLPPDAGVNAERWLEMGPVAPFSEAPWKGDEADLFVDALFGIGLTRPLAADDFAVLGHRVCDPGAQERTVAIDLPSGLCSDSAVELSETRETMLAALTVTFHGPKPAHLLGWGPFKCGRLRVVDIGLTQSEAPHHARWFQARDVRPVVDRADMAHKYSHGHALILAGGVARGGAARLAARGALRMGAGLVTAAPPPAALIENAARLDAIMLRAVRDAAALEEVLQDDRINAVCLGPGLGLERARRLVPAALRAHRGTVLDADALTAFEGDPDALFELLHEGCVLTPHMGEFARLFPDLATKLDAIAQLGPAYSKIDAVRDAAARAGCTVLLKGHDTVIASPDGRVSVNASAYDRAAPWLATAGSGDVLAGFTTGLLARGFAPHDAAATAAYLHTECALEFGPGLIAEDLPEQLPAVLRRMHANSP